MTAKAKIILSDLHLGAGRDSEGNALEDFSSDADFADLIDALVEESDTRSLSLELIFAGDTFEFLQVPALTDPSSFAPGRVYPPDAYASSSEVASLSKVETILAGHPAFFAALRNYVQASAPPRCITFVKGNHDVNLHWSGVQRLLRAAVGAVGARESCVAFEERRISREGIYVEHGNQYVERINRFPDFEEPHDPDAPGDLYRPPGSRFVYNYFNALERQYRWLDGVKPITALVWYLFAVDTALAIRALLALMRELPALVWGSLPVSWALSTYLETHERLLAELQDERQMRAVEHSPDRLAEFYKRVAFALELYSTPTGPDDRAFPAGWRDYAVLPRAEAEEAAQRSALRRMAERKRDEEGARVIVFGHTHEPVEHDLGGGAAYLNCGTWTWSHDFGQDYAAWKRLRQDPDQFMGRRRLSYVRVDYDSAGQPSARLVQFERAVRSRRRWPLILGRPRRA